MAIKQQFCKNGHDKSITGQLKRGQCIICLRKRQKLWQMNNRYRYKDRPYMKNRKTNLEIKRDSTWKIRGVRNIDGSLFKAIDYDRLYQIQQGNCAICKKHQTELGERLHVDHDHTTGIVRGLLCRNCNARILPTFENKERYELIVSYLGWTK
jgi:hypothetical protein